MDISPGRLYEWIFIGGDSALRITTDKWSLTVAKASVTAEKPCRTVTMIATT